MSVPPVATAAQSAVPAGETVEAHEVVAGRRSPEDVCRFLGDVVPVAVAAALAPHLPEGAGPVRARVTRTKLKPGRKLTVSVDLAGDGIPGRPGTLTWWSGGESLPVPDDLASRATAALRVPFATLSPPPDASGMTILLAPLDPAFPQLLDVYDPVVLAGVLAGAGVTAFEAGLRVRPLRYRPGQRHVLLVESLDGRRSVFAKCYRDGSGARAIEARRAVAEALSAHRAPARTARFVGSAASLGLVLWEGEPGAALSHVLLQEHPWGAGPLALVRDAGAALRAIHDSAVRPGADGDACTDPAAEAAATRRSLEHVTALAPRSAVGLEGLLSDTVARLAALPDEQGHLLHGDYKCDNLLVSDGRLVLLDFDRVTHGDPALDVGKLVADLRWWARVAGRSPRPLVDAFLYGYGPCPPTRVTRALHHDVLFQLRALGRRVPLHEPGWGQAVEQGLVLAGECARDCSRESARQTRQVLGARAR